MSETAAAREMPRYKSHRVVHALKIERVEEPPAPSGAGEFGGPSGLRNYVGNRILHFFDRDYAPIEVNEDWVRKHEPKAAGYYIVYPDGYTSWSPAEAFEDGYTGIDSAEPSPSEPAVKPAFTDHFDAKIRDQIENNFQYHAPKGDQTERYEDLRSTAKMLAHSINCHVPGSREKALALTNLEDSIMWANAGIARNE